MSIKGNRQYSLLTKFSITAKKGKMSKKNMKLIVKFKKLKKYSLVKFTEFYIIVLCVKIATILKPNGN